MSAEDPASMLPLVSICGTTGVGKSKLAIELAVKLGRASKGRTHPWRGARIINADSMQVYTGMDVITNKVPFNERQGIEHLLMDCKSPGEQYVVGEWVRDAIHAVGAFFTLLLNAIQNARHAHRSMRHTLETCSQ
jgi:tRNA dimethylallyltransferase